MTKQEYNLNRPRKECPHCRKLIPIHSYDKHYNSCINKTICEAKSVYKLDHDDLFCKFCNKEYNSKNALCQHELRCKLNPNRKAFDAFNKVHDKLIKKGDTAETNPIVKKSKDALINKYKNGYVSPVKGRKRNIQHIYLKHNNKEIKKWHEYISYINIENNYNVVPFGKDYYIISGKQIRVNSTVKPTFEHDYIANILLNNKLDFNNTVHHIDNNGKNNSKYNLIIFIDSANHKRFHNSNYAYLIYDTDSHLFSCELRKPYKH